MTMTKRQQEWEDRIAEYQASGQSVKEWCAANGLQPARLWYWLRRNRSRNSTSSAQSTRWLPVEVCEQAHPEQDSALLIRVGAAAIEVRPGFDPALLSEVIRVLTRSC